MFVWQEGPPFFRRVASELRYPSRLERYEVRHRLILAACHGAVLTGVLRFTMLWCPATKDGHLQTVGPRRRHQVGDENTHESAVVIRFSSSFWR